MARLLVVDYTEMTFYKRTLDTHIKRLRSSLEEYRSCIVTLRGVGTNISIVSMIIFKRKHLSIKWGDICRDSCLFGNSPAFAVFVADSLSG